MYKATDSRKHILFVCWGNTCRSPMAVGLARKIFGNEAIFESAGIDPSGTQANHKAIEVLGKMGIDIRDHCPRRVSSMNLSDFDFIIAMDSNVNVGLRNLLPDRLDKILSWDIDDPWGGDIEDYGKCAEMIRNKLSDLHKLLKEAEECHQ